MKKLMNVLFLAVCLAIAMPTQAQLKFGVKGGVNLDKASFSTAALKTDNFTGFFIGPMAEFSVPVVGLGVDGGLLFSQRGVKVDGSSKKENGLEIPVNLKYTIGLGSLLGVYVAAGPDFYFNFSKNKSFGNNFKLNRKDAQVGISLGAGIKLLNHLQVGFNYIVPVGKNRKLQNADDKVFSAKTKTWQVSAAYLF